MNLQTVNGCCSMLIISDNPSGRESKNRFKQILRDCLGELEINQYRIKTIVMITNDSFFNRLFYRKYGFRKAYFYKGNGKKAHVMHLSFKTNLSDYLNS